MTEKEKIRQIRKTAGLTQKEFAERYKIPFRTLQNWEYGINVPPEYLLDLLEFKVMADKG